MKVIKDGYAANANPRRGYHASLMEVEFDSKDTPEMREGAKKMILAYLTPRNMWCHVTKFNDEGMTVSYGYDSGD